MSWILYVLITGNPNPVPLLGSDDFQTREATQARLTNLACWLLLPRRSDDPEIQFRLTAIHRRYDRYTSPAYYEALIKRDNYWNWFDKYIVNAPFDERKFGEVFEFLHANYKEANEARSEFFTRYPLRPGESSTWLMGIMVPGEFNKFCEHVARHNKKLKVAAKLCEGFLPNPYGFRNE